MVSISIRKSSSSLSSIYPLPAHIHEIDRARTYFLKNIYLENSLKNFSRPEKDFHELSIGP